METKVKKFVDWLNKEYGETISEYSWSKYKYSVGKKYFKIIRESGPKSSSVYGFVDMNGNFLKANSWRAPHPTPRGHIDYEHLWKSFGCQFGFNYLKPKWVNGFTKTGDWRLIKG